MMHGRRVWQRVSRSSTPSHAVTLPTVVAVAVPRMQHPWCTSIAIATPGHLVREALPGLRLGSCSCKYRTASFVVNSPPACHCSCHESRGCSDGCERPTPSRRKRLTRQSPVAAVLSHSSRRCKPSNLRTR
eukprot:363221-Chlamydomonas_euryale.AAC.5